MKNWTTLRVTVLVFGCLPALALGQTSYPMITHAFPVAIQRGQTSEITVEGQQSFLGAYKVLVEGAGVTAEVVKPAQPPSADPPKTPPAQKPMLRSLKLRFSAAADAMPGVR